MPASYPQTPGLERFPQHERLAVYRAAHWRLLSEDSAYHQRWRRYIASIACLAFIPILGWIAVVFLAIRQQPFQNQRIEAALRAGT